MSNLNDFLVEHAMFPFPIPDEARTIGSTDSDISEIEVGLLEIEWKARHAVKDDNLVQKLCDTLQDILGDRVLPEGAKNHLLTAFSPQLEFDDYTGMVDRDWLANPNEVHSRSLLDKGFFAAIRKCLGVYDAHQFQTTKEVSVEGSRSKVDYVALVDEEKKLLCEAKSPSVMKIFGELLPARGFELEWIPSSSLVRRILGKSALYLGLRQMEWLFLSCHNYWVVCRLVKSDEHPFLAYSSMISIENSSEPFQVFLGAILSVIKGVSVEPSTFNPHTELDIIVEEDEDPGPLPEDDIGNGSEAYRGSSSKGTATTPPLSRGIKRAREDNESALMVTSSSMKSPASFQVWVHFRTFPNSTLGLPQCSGSRKPRLWLTRFVGFGSTGNVWECHFDNNDDLFAVKIVELLRRSDTASRERLRNEFKVYLSLEEAYQSGSLPDRIAPHCYGAFEGDSMDVLVLELCDSVLREWDELSDSERAQVYKLVFDLHSIGILHGDLEPRNVARVPGGGFRLIDFSESKKHFCKERKTPHPVQKQKCSELQTLRQLLWGRRPLQHGTDMALISRG